jgi:hypothetical protein
MCVIQPVILGRQRGFPLDEDIVLDADERKALEFGIESIKQVLSDAGFSPSPQSPQPLTLQ